MERLENAGLELATQSLPTTCRQACDEARHVLREAWQQGVEHRVQLAALGFPARRAAPYVRQGGERAWNATTDGDTGMWAGESQEPRGGGYAGTSAGA